jgi:hypothetical protein
LFVGACVYAEGRSSPESKAAARGLEALFEQRGERKLAEAVRHWQVECEHCGATTTETWRLREHGMLGPRLQEGADRALAGRGDLRVALMLVEPVRVEVFGHTAHAPLKAGSRRSGSCCISSEIA